MRDDYKWNELLDEKDPIVTVISFDGNSNSLSMEYMKSSVYASRVHYFPKIHMVFAGRIACVKVVASGFNLETV